MSIADSPHLGSLPKFWDEHRRVLIETPIRIAVIIIVALILRAV
ncbi:MAG: hypothetical protein QOC66_3380, partial [Pseudonocardiales bacterium]|nr:hypothetical protein [Pseudonocardiales bacterium]